ncbi:MAG TPA: PqqD family peptide modification chaperone [Chloroflexota bacterium]|nr:PqqD family peptide modification chaperone [Chloroflexota bacterium]
MGNVILLARLLLFGVFGVAGAAKLVDQTGEVRALVDFGVPSAVARPLRWLLPIVEIAVALALLPVETAWWGALGAAVLLIAFLVGIGASVARGRHPDCHCFGQLHSAPVGAGTIARNAVLAALAFAIVGAGPESVGPSAIAWLGDLTPGQLVGVLAGAIGLGILIAAIRELVGLRERIGRLEALLAAKVAQDAASSSAPLAHSPASLPIGETAPSFQLPDLLGKPWSLADLLAPDKQVLLLFADAQCGPCNALFPEVGRWQREARDFDAVVVSRNSSELNQAKASEHGLTRVLLQEDREVARAYGALGTPSAVLVGPAGRIQSPVAVGAEAIRALVAQAFEPTIAPIEAPPENVLGHVMTMLDWRARPEPHRDLTISELDGETVLYDQGSGQVHQLNPTATRIWSLCDGTRSIDAIARSIADAYAITLEQARADVGELIARLSAANLLRLNEEEFPRGAAEWKAPERVAVGAENRQRTS